MTPKRFGVTEGYTLILLYFNFCFFDMERSEWILTSRLKFSLRLKLFTNTWKYSNSTAALEARVADQWWDDAVMFNCNNQLLPIPLVSTQDFMSFYSDWVKSEVKRNWLWSLESLAMMFNKSCVTAEGMGRRGTGPLELWAGFTDAQKMMEKLTWDVI